MTDGGFGTRAAPTTTAPPSWPWWSWALTFASYVALGYVLRSLVLNWIVGPLYPLFVMYLVPTWLRRLFVRAEPPDPDDGSFEVRA